MRKAAEQANLPTDQHAKSANISTTQETESANIPATQETERTRLLVGEAAVRALAQKRVAVFGIGGVGGYAAEALARAGVGAIDLVDDDKVALSDINRQIYALHSTVGMFKTDVAARRIADISPACKITAYRTFFLPSNADELDFSVYDYVVDAIDTVAGKLAIIGKAKRAGVPVVSAMGAGNKLDPCAFEVADIFSTSVCPLAKVMRKKLREMGVDSLKVVYSKEEPRCDGSCGIAAACAEAGSDAVRVEVNGVAAGDERVEADGAACAEPVAKNGRPQGKGKKRSPGSISFVPPVVGFILAGEVIKDLIGINRK